MDALLPVVIGGLIGLTGGLIGTIGSLVGAWMQSRHDQYQWVRRMRLDAYLPAVAYLREFEFRASVYFDLMGRVEGAIPRDATSEEIADFRTQYAAEQREYHDYLSRVDGELAPVVVVGPEPVRKAVEAFEKGARERPTAWFNGGRDFPAVMRAMRDALDIRD